MDIHQVAERFRVSVRKLRAMEKLGILKLEPENPYLSKVRYYVGKSQPIPVLPLLYLVENPDAILELGKSVYEAQSQVDALELEDNSAAPAAISMTVDLAATRDNPAAVEGLCDWLQAVIPSRPVPYHFLAVRLLLGAKPAARAFIAGRIHKALLNVRALERFAGWSYVDTIRGRKATLSVKGKLGFDM